MIVISKDIIYTKGNFSYKNFISLTEEEKLTVLDWRNHENIRKWMYNQDVIEEDSHFAFIKSLEKRQDCFYWLVFREKTPIGVFSITDIDYQVSQASSGFYIDPYHEKAGNGFEFIHTYTRLMFDFKVKRIYVGILSSNQYVLLINLFIETIFETEKCVNGQKYLYGTLTKENYFNDIDKKESMREFAKFVRNYMTKSDENINSIINIKK
ncbi:MAG: UDP-4-amino-4,6-dideoxy-N-acetyl-beta-L-altrosamine N-acetyltransferase [Prevotellaceae bacterium]|jgi:UDP-4-amino-4,6-dideoxy-N-acetyl-beta-L-altrosamine N-acetyltransferase|nr:UDP-4-amino-4,6-dideoxy-N-acetyl-beta-L-altrosamine N-acetyltransferase [Prevotellaceae bacterium]